MKLSVRTLAARLGKTIENNWYRSAIYNSWLLPLLPIYVALNSLNQFQQARMGRSRRVSVPVVVIGNMTVGGTGKTPLITYLAKRLERRGARVGVVSRGYGGHSDIYPLRVDRQTAAEQGGDEPVMLANRGITVCVDPNRYAAAKALENDVDIIISDDGLQHRKLPRNAELIVVDGKRKLGNGWQLPIGPLRESADRLASVDLVLTNGDDFNVRPAALLNAVTGDPVDLNFLNGRRVLAVSGIGNPSRFHRTLVDLGANIVTRDYPDHHRFQSEDLTLHSEDWLVMTEKDWVKCRSFCHDQCLVLTVDAQLKGSTEVQLDRMLERLLPILKPLS